MTYSEEPSGGAVYFSSVLATNIVGDGVTEKQEPSGILLKFHG